MRIKLNLFTLTNQPRQIYSKWSPKQESRWVKGSIGCEETRFVIKIAGLASQTTLPS
jgi:hypothetical protein